MLWIALAFTQLPLEARWRNDAEPPPPRALAREHRIALCNPAAAAAGIRLGQKRGLALDLCPQLNFVDADETEQVLALGEVALALSRFTPSLAFVRSAGGTRGLLLEVQGCLKLFGGFQALLHAIRFTVAELGLSAEAAAFTTATGAWLLAQHGATAEVGHAGRHPVDRAGDATTPASVAEEDPLSALDALPSALLDAARPCVDMLVGIGCGQLGALRHFPRDSIAHRFGNALLHELDRAYGEAPDPRDFWQPPERFEARLELMARVDHAEALLFAGRRLLIQLVGWLGARQAATRGFVLQLDHEGHRDDGPRCTPLVIGLSEPTRDLEHLSLLLREHLARSTLPAPVFQLRLEAQDLHMLDGGSRELFPSRAQDDLAIARLAERLSARLGPGAVQTIALLDDHRPEAAQALHAFGTPAPASHFAARRNLRAPGAARNADQLPRPTWLLSRPVRLRVRNERPWHHGDLRLIAGPERVEGGWWDEIRPAEPAVRDYFIAENTDAELLWLFRERRGSGDEHWFLHGKFA
ncbi:Y-family DNA polymerase [Derxia lacustris]|uniref:Y-family DNA polymerase n=1 Tax=Derxia lacustris TaxID=764842 RepID=UPI000A174018|nr:DNA polymerase Y family protein [Derxia lacustris]